MAISALVTDLDGTFWSTEMTLNDASVDTVALLDEHDIPFVIATGRRAQSTLGGLRPVGLSDRPTILMNGALVRDRLDGPSFHRSLIAAADAQRTREIFQSHGLEPLIYIDDPERDVLAGPNAAAAEGYIGDAPGVHKVDDLTVAMADVPITGFGAFGYRQDFLARIQSDIESEGLASAIISPSHYEQDYGLMVQGTGVDKATGLDAYCERHGVDRDGLAVVGDGLNDVGMLSTAAIAIVPTNAPVEVQAIADALIEPNELGGWKQIPSILGM